jgi:hypothetical protein
MARTLRVGCGAGFSGDRLDAALVLAEHGQLDWLALECLAERTIALAQLRRRRDPASGFDPQLHRRIEALLPIVKRTRMRIITNMGAANPMAAGQAVMSIARRLGIRVRVAVVTGDDVLADLDPNAPAMETRRPLSTYGPLVSANAYLGAEALLPAIESGADVIITGRVADPSLFVAPIMDHYGWPLDDWDHLASATSVGHLLECAGQLCGGYFADPGRKDVADMAHLGFPYADVEPDGSATVGKVEGTGGCITLATAKEQLLYEVTDPCAYLTPDVTADFSAITLEASGKDRIAIRGARANGRPEQLKVSVGYMAGFVGEGEIAYAGPNALARGELAANIVQERLAGRFEELRIDLIGSSSLHGRSFDSTARPYEVRLRAAGRAKTAEEASVVGDEVEALYTNGPAGGGGARRNVYEQVGIVSTFIARERVMSAVTVVEEEGHVETV